MNGRITNLYRVIAVLFSVLIGTVTYWQVIAAPSLATRQSNQRLVYRELSIDRGDIISADGVVLARNRKVAGRDRDHYVRVYPQNGLAAALVGYSTIEQGRTGLEAAYNDVLTGSDTDLEGALGNLLDSARGRTVKGSSLELTLSAKAQREAMVALRETGHAGAVVALDPETGAVLTMASWPTFDPAQPQKSFGATNAPLLNRATQGLYAPGSAFKVVTAATALDRGIVTPLTIFPGPACIVVQTKPLCNFRGEAPGPHTFTYALVHSINTTFAKVGQELGQVELKRGMEGFGFFSKPGFGYPANQIAASGLYGPNGMLPRRAPIDVARTAIGQGRLLATPLQMAMVAGAIANGGEVMTPQAVAQVRDPSGRVVRRLVPESAGRAIDSATAATLSSMMRNVVDDGTGGAAQIEGVAVAGKTGTAETGQGDLNQAWFIAFAPADAPRVAIAVVVERTPETGGQVAAPIAARVLQALGVGNAG